MNTITLKDLLTDSYTGLIKSAYTSVNEAEAEVETEQNIFSLVKLKNLAQDGLNKEQSKEKIILSDRYKKSKSKDFRLKVGDILVAVRGVRITMCLMTEDDVKEPITFDTNIFLLRVDEEQVKPEVIYSYLQSPMGQATLKGLQKGAAIPSIRPREFVSIKIPLLELNEQQEIVQEFWASRNLYLSTLDMADKQKCMADSKTWSRFVG